MTAAGESPAVEGGGACGFGPKSAWLAIRSDDPKLAARELGLERLRRASWREGLEEVTRQGRPEPAPVFVTPPVEGWTLVVLPASLAQADPFDFARLSRMFGDVQKFASHRVVESHAWQRWVNGEPVRRYWSDGESGRIPVDDGEPAVAERAIARASDLGRHWDELEFADEDTVLDVAREWSVDPTTIDYRTDVPPTGLLGYVATET